MSHRSVRNRKDFSSYGVLAPKTQDKILKDAFSLEDNIFNSNFIINIFFTLSFRLCQI